jgi:hypothetical protein
VGSYAQPQAPKPKRSDKSTPDPPDKEDETSTHHFVLHIRLIRDLPLHNIGKLTQAISITKIKYTTLLTHQISGYFAVSGYFSIEKHAAYRETG